MEKAIELNENRAVYRSQLQLDSDLAARSASLARGLHRSRVPTTCPSGRVEIGQYRPRGNFSAHRFLADSYSILPRHEVARVSELLQSQLLQPLNMTPIQPPSCREQFVSLLSAGGPGALSFNEFNPLFNRDRSYLSDERS